MTGSFERIDKFYLVLTLVLIFMAALFVFSVRGVISMFLSSRDIGPESIGTETRVQREDLNDAYNYVFSKNVVKLGRP